MLYLDYIFYSIKKSVKKLKIKNNIIYYPLYALKLKKYLTLNNEVTKFNVFYESSSFYIKRLP